MTNDKELQQEIQQLHQLPPQDFLRISEQIKLQLLLRLTQTIEDIRDNGIEVIKP